MLADRPAILYLPGPLMLAVMGALWRDKMTFAGLCKIVKRDYKPVAISTVSTTITRLVDRGWIQRVSYGYYAAAISRAELRALVTEAIDAA